jgi:ketosteroid isomerase-like protein
MRTDETQELAKELRARLDYFEEMFAAGDMETLAKNFYTEDAVVEGYGMPPQTGRRAIAAAFDGARSAGLTRIKVDASEAPRASGDLAYQFITNDNDFAGQTEVHRALIVWRRTSDGWMCEVDFFTPRP